MAVVNARGFTLIEALVALVILALTVVALLPAFITHVDANTRSELRSGAVGAAQAQMESLRLQDPASLPESGSSAPQVVSIDSHDYEVVTHYCERSEYCSADGSSRHLRVEVRHDGRAIYEIETVFTQLL